MAYISKRHLGTTCIVEVCQINFLDYEGYNMPRVNKVIFTESKFALLFQHTTENNFGSKQHLTKEWSIHNE